jgi:hypothetical protein
MQPLLDNLAGLLTFTSVKTTERIDDIPAAPSCGLCRFIVFMWPTIAEKVKTRQFRFTRHRGCIVIPYDPKRNEVAYLSLVEPYTVETVVLDAEVFAKELRPPSGMRRDPGEPGLMKKARTLAGAVFDWAKDGFRMATEEQVAARKVICEGCEFWRGEGYNGMGKCQKCGCSGVKLKIAGSECPLKKWGPIPKPEPDSPANGS